MTRSQGRALTLSHRKPDRPDWKRHSSAPLTTASDMVNAVSVEYASQRSSVDNTPMLWRKLEHLKGVLARDTMRLDKAMRRGDLEKANKLANSVARTNALGAEVMAALEARGALAIAEAKPHLSNWRAQGSRKHPERRASVVRQVLDTDNEGDR